VIEIKETRQIPTMSKIIDDLFRRHPFLYERAFCAAFHPFTLYSIRQANSRITTAFLFAPNVTSYVISDARRTPVPVPMFFAKNVLVRWIVESLFALLSTPAGLRFLGADLVCIEQGHISRRLLKSYGDARIVVCAWTVNEPEQFRWLRTQQVTVITDTLFDRTDA
jgi:glycerophosphoryl diester phosphodiesterase